MNQMGILLITCTICIQINCDLLEIGPKRICYEGWILHESLCFMISTERKTWTDAQHECSILGGTLCEPRTQSTTDFLSKELSKQNKTKHYWLGGRRDKTNSARWVWDSNVDEISYTYWINTQPSDLNEECLEIIEEHSFMWNDVSCTREFNFVCQGRPNIISTIVQVNDSESINLLCPIGTLSSTNIRWKRTSNGIEKPLPDTSNYWNVTFPNLVIHSIRWFHYGTYMCDVASKIQNITYLFKVNVIANDGMCPCTCGYRDKLIYWAENLIPNRTNEELLEILKPVLKKLENELKVQNTKLSSYKRKKTSAPDDRKSSNTIGYVGIAFIVTVFGLLVVADVTKLIRFICGVC